MRAKGLTREFIVGVGMVIAVVATVYAVFVGLMTTMVLAFIIPLWAWLLVLAAIAIWHPKKRH